MAQDSDRERGFLTKDNREFLQGDKDSGTRQARHHHRKKIRERLQNALLDFSLVFDHMKDGELQQVFGEHSRPYRQSWKNDDVAKGIQDTLAFVLREAGVGCALSKAAERKNTLYEETLYNALRRVGEPHDQFVHSVKLDVEASPVNPDRLKKKLESQGRGALTYEEIGVLASEGKLPNDF